MEHRYGGSRRGMLRRFAALVLTLAVLCSALPTGAFAAAAGENTQEDGVRTETAAAGGFAGLQDDASAEGTETESEAAANAAEPDKAENPDVGPAGETEAAPEAAMEAAGPEAPETAKPDRDTYAAEPDAGGDQTGHDGYAGCRTGGRSGSRAGRGTRTGNSGAGFGRG